MRYKPIKYLELTVTVTFTSGQITLFDWTLKIILNNRHYLRYLIGYQICISTLGVHQAWPQQSGGGKGTITRFENLRGQWTITVIIMGAGGSKVFTRKQLKIFSKWIALDPKKSQPWLTFRIRGSTRKRYARTYVLENSGKNGLFRWSHDYGINVRLQLIEKPDGWGGWKHSYYVIHEKVIPDGHI